MDLTKRIDDAASYIRKQLGGIQPTVGLILGSGLGEYADNLENPIVIAYDEIPGFLSVTVEGHKGQFVAGVKQGVPVLCMQGRFHYYEGYSQQETTLPVRVMHQLGIKNLLITNAAGGVNKAFAEGALMLITDHINFSGQNPLIGENLEAFGPRFPDMTYVYDPQLRADLLAKTKAQDIHLDEGVYMFFSGPSYETPAEVRLARILGGDAVGMSTAPEAIVARHAGMRVLGLSCITNPAAGVVDRPLHHDEVVEVAARVRSTFIQVLDLALETFAAAQ